MIHLYGSLAARKQRAIEERLALATKNSPGTRDIGKVAKQYILNAGRKDIDDVILNRLTKEDLLQCSKIKGLENLEAALSAKKGVVLASGHFFANRLGKRLLSEIGYPVLSVRNNSPRRHPPVGRVASKYLKQRYVNFVNQIVKDYVAIQDKDCTLKILERLRRNGLVDIHVDAGHSYHMMERPFLGIKRLFPAGFLRIVYLTGAAVVPMLCIGDSSSFTVIFEEPAKFQETSDQETFMSENLARLVEVLESQVSQYPEQWALWGHNL
jgi:lauroyl/myristoyl acyltransferase